MGRILHFTYKGSALSLWLRKGLRVDIVGDADKQGAGATQAFLHSQPPMTKGEAIHISVRSLTIGMLIEGLVSTILTQDLLRHLLSDPHMNLFMVLAISKSSAYFALGLTCVGWYRSLQSLRASCQI